MVRVRSFVVLVVLLVGLTGFLVGTQAAGSDTPKPTITNASSTEMFNDYVHKYDVDSTPCIVVSAKADKGSGGIAILCDWTHR